jgi:hypothetical protein
MSGAQSTSSAAPQDSSKATQAPASKTAGAQLEEDDEFEDFPVEGMDTRIGREHRGTLRSLESTSKIETARNYE